MPTRISSAKRDPVSTESTPTCGQKCTGTSADILGGKSGRRGNSAQSGRNQNPETNQNAEASSRSFNTLRRVLGKIKTGALSSIMVPGDEPDTWDRIYDQIQSTDTMIERNQIHVVALHRLSRTPMGDQLWVNFTKKGRALSVSRAVADR
jgi:hypothetical protein